jgi:RNA polymerase sigma-70 factor (ECF subfamily)
MQTFPGEKLLAHSRELVRRQARRIGQDAAEDLGAETVLRTLRSPPPNGQVEPWMERIFQNLVADSWRRRRPTMSADDVVFPCHEPSPEDRVLAEEQIRLVRETLAQLPPDLRQAVELRYLVECGARNASQATDVAATTVRTRIHRGLSRMRVLLSGLRSLLPVLGGWTARAASLALAPALVTAVVGLPSVAPRPAQKTVRPQAAQIENHLRRVVEAATATVMRGDSPKIIGPAKLPRPHPLVAQATSALPAAPAPKIIIFDPDQVTGDIKKPDGVDIEGQPARLKWDSLIEIPANFVSSVEKMVEDRL